MDHGDVSYILHDGSTEIKRQFPDKNPHLRFSSDTGDAEVRVEMEDDGSTKMFLIVRNATLNCTVKLHTSDLHGNLILHPVFFTMQFSPDSSHLIYMAEALYDTDHDTWTQYTPNIAGIHSSYKEKNNNNLNN